MLHVWLCAGGPAAQCGRGADSEGGAMAAGGGPAADHRQCFGTGAGAGEGAAWQGGTAATETVMWFSLLLDHGF